MKTAVELECRCGKVKGTLLSTDCLHLRCWCDSCMAFARWLESRKAGSTRDCVDKSLGTEVFQFFRDQVLLDAGQEFIVGTKLIKKTITVRYISKCCHTALFSTPDSPFFVPIVAVFASFIVNKVDIPLFSEPVDYKLFAMEEAKEAQDGTMVRNGMHYIFLLRTFARILRGILFRKYTPNPADQTEGGATIIISDMRIKAFT